MRAAALLVLVFVIGCSSGGYASGAPAGTGCGTDYDCDGELNCVYTIGAGCTANGVCTNMQQAGTGRTCPSVNQVCTCGLTTIDIPKCWSGVATRPALRAGACGAEAGATDASGE